MAEETEVRRSDPAEYIEGVPDSTIDWQVWVREDEAVTIYNADGEFYVVHSEADIHNVYGSFSDKEKAQERFATLRQNSQ